MAQTSGNFTYTDNGDNVTITGYLVGAPTNVIIPATITVSEDPLVVKPVVSIGDSAFVGRLELTSVSLPSGVTQIARRAFYNCSGVTTVTMQSGLTTIGESSFFGCVALSNISIPSSVTSIGKSAFNFCSSLKSMPLQPGLLTIGIEAFSRCGGLTSVTIPPGVTTIGVGAFSFCSGLKDVEIPSSVVIISNGTFSNCSGLTSVTLPSTITTIGTFAFEYCSGLTSITIPNVGSLPNRVFANCRGLTSVNIPASVTTVHVTAFADCSALTSFTVDSGNLNYSSVNGLLTDKVQTKIITCPGGLSGNFTIPTGLTAIGIQAFQTCTKLTGVTFHPGVTSIANKAFSGCAKLINAVFLGDPPTLVAANAFELVAEGFKIYYLTSGTGFTSPDWEYFPGFTLPAVSIGAVTPEFTWLSSYGLPGNSDLLTDANGDGINLLMAYALNMNPNLRNTFPQPVFSGNQMSLTYYANTPGISYTVKTSTDLADWTDTGVVLSGSAVARTATVAFSDPNRFMRLEVSK